MTPHRATARADVDGDRRSRHRQRVWAKAPLHRGTGAVQSLEGQIVGSSRFAADRPGPKPGPDLALIPSSACTERYGTGGGREKRTSSRFFIFDRMRID